jgi:decaprenylphosphoryl-5-phosphoribose phosphatase
VFPRRKRTAPPRRRLIRLRSEAKRQRNPALRWLGDLDQAALRLLRTRGHGPVSDALIGALGTAGEWGAVWVATGITGAAIDPPRRRRWLIAAAVAPAAIGVNYGVKVAVGRERPLIEGHPPLARAPSKLSFPSAHATSSVAGATALARVAPGSRPALYGLAGGICLSRPYLGMHYPSYVIAGALLGAVLGRLVPGLGPSDTEERMIDLVVSEARNGRGDSGADGVPAGSGADDTAAADTKPS